ncbi:PHD finger protein [Aphelenchoides avenae]|nr:PHD finger protein [Aphelenchus avenae]
MPATEGHDAQPADEQQLLGEVESMSLSQNRENITQNNTAPNNGAQSGVHCSADEEEPIFRPNIRRLIETESDPEDESQRPTINVVIDEDVDDTDEQHLSEEAGGSTAHTNGLPEHQDHDYALVGDTQLRRSIKDNSEPPIPTIPPLEEYFSEHAAQDQIIPAEVKYVSSRHTDAHRHGINLASYRPTQTQPTRIITRQPIGSPQQAYRPRDFTSSSQERRTTLVPANAASLMPRRLARLKPFGWLASCFRSVEVHHRRSLEETPRSLPPSNLRRPLGVEGRVVPASSTPSVEPARPVNANQHAPFIVPASGPKYMNRSRTVRQRADQSGAASGAYVHYDHPGPRKSDSPAKSHESPTRPHTSPYHQFSSPAQPTPESTLIDVVQEEEEQNAKFFQQQQRHHLLKGLGGAKAHTQAATPASSSLGQQSQAAQQEPVGNAVEQIPTATSGTTLTTLTQEQPVDSAITSPPSHLRPYDARARTVSETAAPLGQQVPQYAADSSQSPQQQDVYSRPTIMRNRQPASSSGYPTTNVRVEVPISGGMTQSVTAQPMDDGMRQFQREFGEHRRAGTGMSPQRGVPRYEYYDSPRSSGGSPQMRQQQLMEERQRPMAYNDPQGAPADEFAHRVSRSGLAELAHASQITQRHISSPPRYAEETPAYRQSLAYTSPERAGNFIQEADSSGGLGHQPHEYQPGRRAHKRVQSPAQQDAAQEPRSAADSTEARPRRRGRRPTQEVNEEAKKEEEWGDYTTRCLCGLEHNDPFMIMCDACSVWQHGLCMGVDEKHVPEQYYCELCAPRKLKNDPAKARAMQEELLERVRKHADSQKKGSRGRKSAGVAKSRRMSKEDHRERAASRNESRVSSHSSTGAEQQVENKLSRSLRIFVNSHQHHDKGDVHLLDALVRDATKELIVAPAIKGLVATKKGGFQAGEPITEYRAHLHFVTDNLERFNVAPKNGLIYRGLGDDEKLAIYADASKASSEARSARRSCQPNAKIRHAIKDGRLHLLLVATEPIDETEEITIPFEKEYQLSSTPVSCACGATDNADPASFDV